MVTMSFIMLRKSSHLLQYYGLKTSLCLLRIQKLSVTPKYNIELNDDIFSNPSTNLTYPLKVMCYFPSIHIFELSAK